MGKRLEANYSIHDYVKDSEKNFDEQGFNEIDGLVLSQISNMDLGSSGIDLYSGNSKTFAEIWSEMDNEGTAAHDAYTRMDKDARALIEELANSPRYQNMIVSNFVKDPAKEKIEGFSSVGKDEKMEQFAAVTITYKENGQTYNYVSYRATDGTSDGWAEDLAMLYSMGTQAQLDSVAYMNIIAGMTEGDITGGGHSKGGGDFEYAYLFCDDEVRKRIVKGYVYDSPGLTKEVLGHTDYYEDYQRITDGSFVCPQDSIIGQLLHESDNAIFVESVESGFNQHDPYSWEIDSSSNSFKLYPGGQTKFSRYIDDAIDKAVVGMTQEERETFFEFVSYLLYNNGHGEGIDGLGKLFSDNWENEDGSFNWYKLNEILEIISADWNSMTPEEQEKFLDSLGTAVVAFAVTAYDYAEEELDKWIEEQKARFKEKVEDAWMATKNWISEKRKEVKNFLSNVYTSITVAIDKVMQWIRNYSPSGVYASLNTTIKLDTYRLRNYAQRIQNVNRRINNLDSRLDSLYWKVGLLDLWDLMQADLMTGYSWRLLRCVSYLNDTASDFDTVETRLISSL